MIFCTKCIMPASKPNLTFDSEGVCSACRNHELKKQINWQQRLNKLKALAYDTKKLNSSTYDILVPVSGGKDSITQVYYAVKELELKTLAVNVDYGLKTDIGKENLALIPEIGCDLITYRPNQELHKLLVKEAFFQTGTPDAINHPLLYCYPMHLAEQLNISLVMFGENPEFEYIGNFKVFQDIDEDWYDKNISYSISFIDRIELEYNKNHNLKYYFLPINRKSKIIFLGDYIFWDSEENLKIAKKYGFKSLDRRTGTYRGYSGIDEKMNYLHQWSKFCKLGFGRATDHACEDIRNNRISREQALDYIDLYDSEEPSIEYIADFCNYIRITRNKFLEVMKDKNRRIV